MANFPDDIPIWLPAGSSTPLSSFHTNHHNSASGLGFNLNAGLQKIGTGASTPTAFTRLQGTGTGTSGWITEHSFTASYFGIQGDNGDETTALLNALDDIDEGTEIVFEGTKTYTFGHIEVPHSYIRFTGGGGTARNLNEGATIQLADGTDDSLFYIPLTSAGVEFSGLTLNGNSANQTGTSHGIEFEEGDGLPNGDARHKGKVVHDLYITDFLTDGIHGGRSAAGLVIDSVQILLCGGDGIRLAGDTDSVSHALIGFNGRYGVFVEGPSAHLTDCDIYQNLKGLYLAVFGGGGATATNTTVSNCIINVNQEEGIYIEDAVLYTTFTGVHLSYNGSADPGTKAQVYFAGSTASTKPAFTGCVFYANPASPVPKYDYEIESASGHIRDSSIHYGHYTTAISNRPDNIDLIVNGPLTTNGQIVFPGTPNPSTNVNTLDDYKEGTFTPVLTCATPGTLAVTYSTQSGRYRRIGNWVWYKIRLATASITQGTASGSLRITGLPYACTNGTNWIGATVATGWGKGGTYTQVNGTVTTGTDYVQLLAGGIQITSLYGSAFLQVSDLAVDGTQFAIDMTGFYEA